MLGVRREFAALDPEGNCSTIYSAASATYQTNTHTNTHTKHIQKQINDICSSGSSSRSCVSGSGDCSGSETVGAEVVDMDM